MYRKKNIRIQNHCYVHKFADYTHYEECNWEKETKEKNKHNASCPICNTWVHVPDPTSVKNKHAVSCVNKGFQHYPYFD